MNERQRVASPGGTMWERAPAKEYIVGLDLGQASDFSALTVFERVTTTSDADGWLTGYLDEPRYEVQQIQRFPLGAPYPHQVRHVRNVIHALKAAGPVPSVDLVVDQTGVGRAVADLLLEAQLGCRIVLVTITGSDTVSEVSNPDAEEYRVPKRDLASSVLVLLQSKRLAFARSLEMAPLLKNELTGFRVKISLKTGHDSYGAGEDWRSAQHDDLVLSAALACWWGEHDDRNDIGMDALYAYYDRQFGRPTGTTAARATRR